MQLRMTLKEFYANLGDLTAPKRDQPGASVFKRQMGMTEAPASPDALVSNGSPGILHVKEKIALLLAHASFS